MKSGYATILSSENFVPGVKALFRGIRKFSEKDFLVFVSENICDETRKKLENLGMLVISEKEPMFSEGVISKKQASDRWNRTLFKFVIFKEHGYDKLVYIDSDMLVRQNIDELFDKPEWSAVSDRDFFPEYSRGGLNAGIMVVCPSDETYYKLLENVPVVAQKQDVFGDQDVINEYLKGWEEDKTLHLDRKYNTCFYSKCGKREPKAVHFIFEDKPWMWSFLKVILRMTKWVITGNINRIGFFSEYRILFKR